MLQNRNPDTVKLRRLLLIQLAKLVAGKKRGMRIERPEHSLHRHVGYLFVIYLSHIALIDNIERLNIIG